MSFLKKLNEEYLKHHIEKENDFWSAKMDLSDALPGKAEESDIALKEFIADSSWIGKIREELKDESLNETDRIALNGWLKFFEANAIESDDAKALIRDIVELEGEFAQKRKKMKLGYFDPKSGNFVDASSVALRLILNSNEDTATRKAAFEGLRSLETFCLENGFIDMVKMRNRLGKLLGYEDFYDYRVQINEGFTKHKLFELLDELEEHTRDACKLSVQRVAEKHGDDMIEPWNFGYVTGGDLTKEKDPYLSFSSAVTNWGKSFAAMGIKYSGAELTLDLVERKGKYENGFMHGPFPAYIDDGVMRSAKINFTANSVPGQPGSGQTALATLFHEGGHAAHFSNIKMPAPCFSQEFAPTSIAFAETQSMFMDNVVEDADWLTRYAIDENGNSMPFDLIKKILDEQHTFRAHLMRKLMIVPYFEKAIYELPEEELTAENILRIGREIESKMVFQSSDSRPILSVPHILDSESSAYYHAYVLALMAVYQTREFFLKRDGFIMDNPNIGRDMAKTYWNLGNSKPFLEFIKDLTGDPFSAKATVNLVNMDLEDVYRKAEADIKREKDQPHFEGPIDLDATVSMIHGDENISSSINSSFELMAEKYNSWIQSKDK